MLGSEQDTRATVLKSMDEELALWSFHFTKNRRNKCIVQTVRGVPNESPLRDVATGHDRGFHCCGIKEGFSLKDALK